MKDKKILINCQNTMPRYVDYIDTKRIKIDKRKIYNDTLENLAASLSEYDAIVLDSDEIIYLNSERQKQLINFLSDENKIFVVILRHFKQNSNLSNVLVISAILNKYLSAPDSFYNIQAKGEKTFLTSNAVNNIFYKCINGITKWELSFYDRNIRAIVPLARNTDNNIISFHFADEDIKAHNIFIPSMNPENEEAFWEILNAKLLSQNTDFSEVDEWVKKYKFAALNNADNAIVEIENKIREYEEEKESQSIIKNKYERIRNTLLYYDGDLLHEVCKEVLNYLELPVEYGEKGKEDLVLVFNDNHYIFEIKGCEKSTSKGHIRQIAGHVAEYNNKNEVKAKGVFIINAWRKYPLEERDTSEKPIFPNDINKLVEINSLALLTTQQLFVAYMNKLNNTFNREEFMVEVYNTVGFFKGYNNIAEYKIIENQALL